MSKILVSICIIIRYNNKKKKIVYIIYYVYIYIRTYIMLYYIL
jgi:hypothetical protein